MKTTKVAAALVALLIGGCAGFPAFSHPVSYSGNGAEIRGSASEPPSATILAAGSARSTTVVAEAEARRISARAGVTESRARILDQIWVETRECRATGHSLSACLGPGALPMLTAEDNSYLMGMYGFGGGVGMGPGAYFPMLDMGPTSAYADTVGGYGSVGSVDTSRRLDALEDATRRTAGTLDTYVRAADAEGGR